MQYLTETELPIWADPQGNVIMEKCRDHCFLYFDCWLDNEPTYADYIGKITFQNAWAVTSLDIEFYDIYPKEEFKYKSSIFVVENSLWLKEMFEKRVKHYDNWTGWKDKIYHHFHFAGHNNYFDIIAESYKVEKIPKTKTQYFKRLWE
ncbi:hypothetical protein EG359_01110 [Chryseobacterium joostei]|uniref:Uncharacterized protein n=1 Tax=Chryseobacterium joostei TaxID=112234 RepID=A0A1N7IRM1_9FLAO|nr:hypothetical protein [Chryseobacterium joostei]AZA98285.1 hypothetical protein EG359_01110 [Chryseobacterium joostei]SIS39743.1 hypothetical protein SAMN05421768_106304 [Chryseobacterium joostei]